MHSFQVPSTYQAAPPEGSSWDQSDGLVDEQQPRSSPEKQQLMPDPSQLGTSLVLLADAGLF